MMMSYTLLNEKFSEDLLYFILRVRCRREESSHSLSHLLMSFLLRKVATRQTNRQINKTR